MTATQDFIERLARLKPGELGLLRTHAGKGLDETVNGFDLFAGIWWPLREKNERAPRREVAWLIAKLYAYRPLEHTPEATFARQLGRRQPREDRAKMSHQQKVDALLSLPLRQMEPALQWALDQVAEGGGGIDWVRLTDELSEWERESTRQKWAEQYLETAEGVKAC